VRLWLHRAGLILAAIGLALSAGVRFARADNATASAPGTSSEKEVMPLLQAKCLRCHGEKKRESGLDLRSRGTMLQGGDSGPAVVPGKPDESLLLRRVRDGEMPPKKEEHGSP